MRGVGVLRGSPGVNYSQMWDDSERVFECLSTPVCLLAQSLDCIVFGVSSFVTRRDVAKNSYFPPSLVNGDDGRLNVSEITHAAVRSTHVSLLQIYCLKVHGG